MAFTFPPPPPPPPKAAANSDARESYASQRGGGHNARGGDWGRGRGRGVRGRGHGSGNSFRDSGSRGGQGHGRGGHPDGNWSSRGGQRDGFQDHVRGGNQNRISGQGHYQQNSTNHAANGANAPAQYPQSTPQQAGNKRKRNDRTPNPHQLPKSKPTQNTQQQPSSKPPKAKAAPAPAVPSFGFSLPPAASKSQDFPKQNGKSTSNKRKVNLGLTRRQDEDDESCSDEHEDEEAVFAANVRPEGAVFDHNGESISLQTPEEIMAWIKDRRRNYPTQKKVAQKKEEAATQRQKELEFLERVTGKKRKERLQKVDRASNAPEHKASPNMNQEELAALRKKHHESMINRNGSSATTKFSTVDLGLGYGSETEADSDASSVLSESSVVSSSSSDADSDPDASDGDSDAPPAQEPTKQAPAVPIASSRPNPKKPPIPKQDLSDKPEGCPYWEKNKHCKYGKNCRFSHKPREEKRKGLFEKMVEQEVEKRERLAVEAVKYLGRHGFLG